MRKLAALLAALPLAGCIGIADAGGLVDVSIVDASSGQRLEVYRHHGRLYVAGAPGSRYSVVLRNQSGGRVLTVLSVDGVNALNGQTASFSQSGYVLPAWQSAAISGWRKSMDDVAAFYFTSLGDSYAGRTDRPQNIGVIGVAIYREAEPVPSPQATMQSRERDASGAAEGTSSNAAAKASAPARDDAVAKRPEGRLGTGHGERISAPSQYTDFRRATDSPSEIVTIHYDSRSNLLAQGIIPRARPHPALPNPFPGGFTPDPRS
jgi:hypothetical protein